MIIREIKLVSYGRCPMCNVPILWKAHEQCVVIIAQGMADGTVYLHGWENPLPGQFQALRQMVAAQIERVGVFIDPSVWLSEEHLLGGTFAK